MIDGLIGVGMELAGSPLGAASVDLVDEQDARGFGFGRREQLSNLFRAWADTGGGARKEKNYFAAVLYLAPGLPIPVAGPELLPTMQCS